MRFLFDQNISHRILQRLPELFKESASVKGEGLINEPDRVIWEFARSNNFVIVPQDSDFNDLTALHGFPPKIVWIRSGNLKTLEPPSRIRLQPPISGVRRPACQLPAANRALRRVA